MKKFVIPFLFFLISSSVFAGFGNSAKFIYFDPTNNLTYVSIGKNEKLASYTKNIAIINSSTNKISYIFEDQFKEDIINMYFESEYNEKEGKVIFNIDYYYNKYRFDGMIKNNIFVNRPIKDKLCIFTFDSKNKKYSIWYCDKKGENLRLAKTFDNKTDWWIDVRNCKVCFVKQVENQITYETIEW